MASGGGCAVSRRVTGGQNLPELLRFLEDASAGGPTDLGASLAAFVGESVEGGVLIVLSDFWSEGDLGGALRAAAERGFDGALVRVLAPEEVEVPRAGRALLTDAETGEELEVGFSPRAAEAYREELEGFTRQVEEAAARAGFRWADLRSDRPLADAVLTDLRRAGVVTGE